MESAGPSDADDQQHEPLNEAEEVTQATQAQAGEEYLHVSAIRRQHRFNLGAIMRHAMLTADYCTAVGAVGALLACQVEDIQSYSTTMASDLAAEVQLLVEMQWNTMELLRLHKVAPEQIKRIIRKTAALLLNEVGMRQTCQIELVLGHWNRLRSEEFKQGLALIQHELSRVGKSTPAFTYHMSVLAAYMHHAEWLSQLQGSTNKPQQQSQVAVTSRQQQRQQQLGFLQLPFKPYHTAGPRLASQVASQADASSSVAQDVEDIVKHLKRALAVFPAASLPALLLCHTLVLAAKAAEALETARAAVTASGRSVESVSLLALLLQPPASAVAADTSSAAAVLAAAVSSQFGSQYASQRLLLGSSSQHDDSDAEDEQQRGVAEEQLHEYAALCLEVLQADPYSTGALQGLLQQSSHCSSCAAHAMRGLLAHLDAAALEAAVAAAAAAEGDHIHGDAAAAADATVSLAVQWSVLSVLLVQFAAAAAVDVAAGTCSTAAAAGLEAVDPTNSAAAAAAAEPAAQQQQLDSGDSAAQLWSTLQHCFAERQAWWPATTIISVAELQLLWQQQRTQVECRSRQQQQQQDDNTEQQGSPVHHSQDISRQQHRWLDGMQGFAPNGMGSIQDPSATVDAVTASRSADGSGDSQAEAIPWTDVHHLLCCKAVALAFVLGPENAYTQEAVAALAVGDAAEAALGVGDAAAPAALGAAAAAAAGVDGDEDEDADGSDGLLTGSGSAEADAQLTAAAARVALNDAIALAHHLNRFQQQQRQQQQQEQQQRQQQGSAAPKRLLGTPSEEFGAMLDLSDSWWASFPHKRRQRRQHQQHNTQHQQPIPQLMP